MMNCGLPGVKLTPTPPLMKNSCSELRSGGAPSGEPPRWPHGAQPLPQSTPASKPFCTPSPQELLLTCTMQPALAATTIMSQRRMFPPPPSYRGARLRDQFVAEAVHGQDVTRILVAFFYFWLQLLAQLDDEVVDG